jgi:hypothetical protein
LMKIYNKIWTQIKVKTKPNDVASPMHDSSCYTIPNYIVATVTASVGPGIIKRRRMIFLFLPQKEKIKYVNSRRIGTWCVLCLKESGWGPPTAVMHLKMVHLVSRVPNCFTLFFYIGLGKWSLACLFVFIFLISFCL